ncbi:MAG: flagellar hook-associated protein 3, partial [Anaerolineaceae bacterium]|nr:flagellar hook-associated protein 3 [Anaerolineaceae bacterium]
MSIGSSGTRVSNALLAQLSTRNINNNMRRLLDLQQQLSTGLRLYRPSVDPTAAAAAMSLQSLVERRRQTGANIDRGNVFLAATDNALADLLDVVNQAASLASSNIGAGGDDQTRQDAAAMVDGLIDQLVLIGNRRVQGRYLFAGQSDQEAPFEVSQAGVRFVGDNLSLEMILDGNTTVTSNVTAEEAFGTLGGRIESSADLSPAVALGTRLSELNGGRGVRLGVIVVGDGSNTARVDLSGCDTVGDIITAINNNGPAGVTATISAAGGGLVLAAGPSGRISVDDLPGGFTARDLGILQTSALGAGSALVGAGLDRTVSLVTELAALRGGAGIDTAGGLQIGVGQNAATVDLSGARTVEGLLNAINYSGLFVRASIGSDGRRLVVANTAAGGTISVGENGGTSAADLGIEATTADSGGLAFDGTNRAEVQGQGVFRQLYALGEALLAGDDVSITQAGSALQDEAGRVARTRGAVGARMQLLD